MNLNIDLNTLISSLAVLLIAYGIKGIFGIKGELAKLNGRLGVLEEWADGHTKLDDERHTENKQRLNWLASRKDKQE